METTHVEGVSKQNESLELQDFTINDNITQLESDNSLQDNHSHNNTYNETVIDTNISAPKEEWQLYEDSSILTRFFYRLWYGPRQPSDEPPTFQKTFNWSRKLDEIPHLFKERYPRKRIRITFLVIYCSLWFGINYILLYSYLYRKPFFYANDSSEKIPIITYDCNSYLNWEGKNGACGLNAAHCLPFADKDYYIRCPALCDRGGWTYSAIEVGDTKVKYRGYEIGGGSKQTGEADDELSYPYRSDSFVCGSAVHADVVSPVFGGCAKVSMKGPQINFPSREGKYNTQFSVAFDSFFPSSYAFKSYFDGIATGCIDPRAPLVTINVLFGLPIFYLYESIIGYWIITIVGYWTLLLALDPPLLVDPHDTSSVYELISLGFQRLLPLCFVLYVEWKSSIKRTLEDVGASPLLKIAIWYPMFWLGVMNNITFDRLPVDRLTPKDLKEQKGAATAVGCIIITILICAIIQAYSLWKSGRFRKFFKIYISFILGLILLSQIPGLNLRIHHYILGAILVPGCATRNLSAYLFQGILIGLILSGVSRWDFASIVETDFALLRGEAGVSMPPPMFKFDPKIPHKLNWQLNLTELETGNISSQLNQTLDGVSLLLNDFEVYVGENQTIALDILVQENQLLNKMIQDSLSVNGTVPLYLRIARANIETPRKLHGDYTHAALLEWPEGIWHPPSDGVS